MSEKLNLEQNSNRSSLADIILVMSKHINIILVITIISVVITIVFTNKNYKPKYVSTTKMFIPSTETAQSGLYKIANQFGLSNQGTAGADISSSSLYPEIVNSKTFANVMLDKSFYTEKYGKKLPLIAIFTHGNRPAPDNIDTLKISAANIIANMVRVSKEMGFFIIDVTTTEPQFSKDFADTMIVELDKLQRKFKKQTVNETIDYLKQKISLAKIELETNEEKLKNFRERNRNVNNSPGLLLTQERLQRDVQIQSGIFLTLKQQLELAKIEEVQKSSFVQILDYPSLPLVESNPKKLSTYIIGGFIGFFLALGLSFVIEYFTNRNEIEASKLKSAKKHALNSLKRIFTLKWKKNK